MTDESNYSIAFALLGYWPKNLALVFQPMRSKSKNDFTRALSKYREIARNSDWFITLATPVVIG